MLLTGSVFIAVIVPIFAGAIFGFFQGYIITKAKVAPFAITLGGLSLFRGITLLFTNGLPISRLPEEFRYFGAGDLGIIPVPVIISAIIFVLYFIILNKTKVGRYVYAIGSNEETTRLTGIKVDKYRIITYIISGISCAIAGIILTGRINSAHPYAGQGYELIAIASVVIGGTSLSGGEGKLYGTIIGALLIGVIQNGLNLLGINAFFQEVAVGLVIIIAVLIDRVRVNLDKNI